MKLIISLVLLSIVQCGLASKHLERVLERQKRFFLVWPTGFSRVTVSDKVLLEFHRLVVYIFVIEGHRRFRSSGGPGGRERHRRHRIKGQLPRPDEQHHLHQT